MAAFLVADDSAAIRLALVAALRRLVPGAEVVEAASDEEALQAFRAREFQAVFLDMMMSDAGTSLHVLRAMLDERPAARIVLTTGLDREHPDVVSAVSHGAFGYLRKPLRTDDVRDVLSQVDAEDGRGGRIR